jgi:hydrogenase maturation protease
LASNPSGPASFGASERETSAAPARIVVIGCGNPTRSDDGVGCAVIHALQTRRPSLPPHIELIDAGTGGMDVMFKVRDAARVVIVDACRSGSEPGAIFRLPAAEAVSPAPPAHTLHSLRWDHALYAAGRMYGESFLDHVEVMLIEAMSLEFGLELTAPVSHAAHKAALLVEAIVSET